MSAPARAGIVRCPARAIKTITTTSCSITTYYSSQPPPWTTLDRRHISSSSSLSSSASSSTANPPIQAPTTFQAPQSPSSQSLFSSPTPPSSNPDPEQLRKVKLGKTLRILQTHLPRLLQTPLPQEVLSPSITLHLFPSTHPHLPTVSGRVAYIAALWSSPIAWNRLPIVGNVRLEILSERMVRDPTYTERRRGAVGEQLVVRWRTVGKNGNGGIVSKLWFGEKEAAADHGQPPEEGGGGYKAPVGGSQAVGTGREFTGLFIFDFDGEGRILNHTIEHVQEGGQWERGVGAKVVGLTDWLLGGFKGDNSPCPAFERVRIGNWCDGRGTGR